MDYVYIRAYNSLTGQFPHYTVRQVELARAEKAPQTAIFKDARGKWHTVANVSSPYARAALDRLASNWI